MGIFIYGVATNTGKNFFTHENRRDFYLGGYTGHDGSAYVDLWVIGANEQGALWLAEKSGTEKTKTQAQALLKAADDLGRTEWDNDNVDGESSDDKIARICVKPPFRTIP